MSERDECLRIDRTIDLEAAPDEAWRLLATPEGWAAWLVDDADVALEDGGSGSVREEDVVRQVRVDEVRPGERVTFTWWHAEEPSGATEVTLLLHVVDGGRVAVRITERLPMTALARCAACGRAWDARLCALCELVASLVPA